MAANRTQLQSFLHRPYDRVLFAKEVLATVFKSAFCLNVRVLSASIPPSKTEMKVIHQVVVYGSIKLEDGTEITCYEITLQPHVRIEQNKVAIQKYARKLLTVGQAAIVNFITPSNKQAWRLTLVAKDSELHEDGVKERITNAKRFTYLLGPSETCKTAAERLEALSIETNLTFSSVERAFSVEKLSKIFFNEYAMHYKRFNEELCKSNFKISVFKGNEKAIRDFTKKLLGRIVFLYFVQKKGWLGASDTRYNDGAPDFIRQLFKSSGGNESFYSNWLTVLFFDTLNKERKDDKFIMPSGELVKVPFLNGGLFDKEDHDGYLLTFNPRLFHNPDNPDDPKHRGFLDFLDGFNFTVHEDSPDDQTVAVDPEMLGHIFENLLEDNNDKGAYYTPKEIVHYMCEVSLREYLMLHSKISSESIEKLVYFKEIDDEVRKQLKKISALLDSVKICDPAIGSGAFPMGLLQEIFAIKEAIAYESGLAWKPADIKENIIQNSIYGVDIEKGAVDIARLRFWLSLIVEEELPRALPNLDYKIVVGDSLVSRFEDESISIDWDIKEGTQANLFGNDNVLKREELLTAISRKQKEYFQPSVSNKKKLGREIRSLKVDILINQLELMIKTKGLESRPYGLSKSAKPQSELYSKTQGWKRSISKLKKLKKEKDRAFHHFDWKLDFPEILNPYLIAETSNRGFDIVIGNPPYIQLQKEGGRLAKQYENCGFLSFEKTGDIYSLFYEKGHELLRANGHLIFITSNKWMRAGYGGSIRRFFAEKTNPLLLVDFAGQKIFDSATVDTNILLFAKAENQRQTLACTVKEKVLKKLSVFVRQHANTCAFTNANSWVILSLIEARINEKVGRIGTPLKEWDIQINYGIKTGFNDAFIIDGTTRKELIKQDSKSDEIIRPILRGRDIKRYGYAFADLWLINVHNGIKENGIKPININDFPAIKRHLDTFYSDLEKRADKGETPYNLRNCAYMDDFNRQKIVWGEISDRTKFCIDLKGEFMTEATTFLMTGQSLLYLLGFLNSRLSEYLFSKIGTTTGMGTVRWKKYTIEQLRVPSIPLTRQKKYDMIVKAIMEKQAKNQDHRELCDDLDNLIYEDIQLTKEEIEFIESL